MSSARKFAFDFDDLVSAADRVEAGIMLALEQQRMVPGQRLVETSLASEFSVGRNQVREAIQRLTAKGIVDVSRNRSPCIRILSVSEALDVLEVAEVMFCLLARVAAGHFDQSIHGDDLKAVLKDLEASRSNGYLVSFSKARRRFYRTLLNIGANRELERLFGTLQMQILYAQYQSPQLYDVRYNDYLALAAAVMSKDAKAAEKVAYRHVKRVRELILELTNSNKKSV